MTNLNLLFHKLYYKQIGRVGGDSDKNQKKLFENDVKARNEEIFHSTFVYSSDFQKCEIPNVTFFRMRTKYPGLLIGTGYPHGSGRADDDIKCGFSFDYVSGQPYIPGSSVKGVLRSHFKDHPEAVAAIANIPSETVTELETHIFDHGDIFLDAVLYDGDEQNRILGDEYIAPHSDVTKNPVPIHIMKVLPDVRFEFRFIVSDFVTDGFAFTGERKKALFQTLLELFGVGAKTNVGYGVLVSDDSPPRARVSQQQSAPKNGTNYGGGGHGNGNRGNNYGNRAANGGASRPEMIKCPHCGWDNYRYNKQGVRNTRCHNFKCGKHLP